MDIKEMVKGNKQVTFMHYRDGDLWYRHDEGFEFPVPIADVGTATLLASDKALLFMRYIRKHAAMLEHANTEPHAGVPLDGRRPVFQRGDHVRKRSGSQWQGHVVGEYSTALTPEGYAVESETHVGSVQIYPAAALERVP